MTNWQPIETAPNTGVLIYTEPMVLLAVRSKMSSDEGCFHIVGGNERIVFKPTHWMPLPEPPEMNNGD